jgi:mannosyl-3-phosphoglycerate phosphatase
MKLVVFSDLDGTLLDHETYGFDAARPALEMLRKMQVALILASSKTAAEIKPIRQTIGFGIYPAIIENGAGILAGGNEDGVSETRSEYWRILNMLEEMPSELTRHFRGFASMTVAEIAAMTGLEPEAASKAAARQFSEPGEWTGTPEQLERFTQLLSQRGVSVRRGGRFLTLSFGPGKAGRMREIVAMISANPNEPVRTIALGDAPNDIEMLEAADHAFIVANPHGEPLRKLAGEADGSISRTQKSGPEGWNEAVLSILNEWEC